MQKKGRKCMFSLKIRAKKDKKQKGNFQFEYYFKKSYKKGRNAKKGCKKAQGVVTTLQYIL